ncbi:MAG: UDP-4-amino-4,6-dideoxy-N-acetyl-beta-L-altrosamine transaminase [Kofleriaceae bacterium]
MIPYGRQHIDDADIAAVVETLRSPMLTGGPAVAKFEALIAAAAGAKHASACSNGTTALHLIYAALGFGPGDEIITTPVTFSATAAAAYYVGASVRFADVDPVTGNLDPGSIEALVTKKTRAIVPVHLGGGPVDLDAIHAIANRHGLVVIEDACHALGGSYNGAPIGSRSLATVFSFHPVKHVTTGEGGAVVTNDEALKKKLDKLRSHGIERDAAQMTSHEGAWSYEVQELGFNYRLPDISCALGISQMAKLEQFIARRREIAAMYRKALKITTPADVPGHAYHLFQVAVDWAAHGTTRARVVTELAQRGIGTQVHYIPLYRQPLHAQRASDKPLPGAEQFYARTLSIPMFPAMTDADVGEVVAQLHAVLGVTK